MQGLHHDKPTEARLIVTNVESCIDDVRRWSSQSISSSMSKNVNVVSRYSCTTPQIPKCNKTISVCGSVIEPATVVWNLGAFVDAELTMQQQHVSCQTSACFFQIRRLCSVRKQLGRQVIAQLMSSLVLSRLDYGNAVCLHLLWHHHNGCGTACRHLSGLRARAHDHIGRPVQTSLASNLETKPIKVMYASSQSLIGCAPEYISKLLKTTVDVSSKTALRSSHSGDFVVRSTWLRL